MNWIPTLILSVFVLAGTGSLIYAWIAYQRGQQSLAWPSVAGSVTASSVTASTSSSSNSDSTPTTTYYPAVTYDYSVSGQVLSSTRIGVGGATSRSEQAAAAIAAQYPIGKKVDVWYDPANPAYAVLVRGPDMRLVATFGFGGAVAYAMAAAAKIFGPF